MKMSLLASKRRNSSTPLHFLGNSASYIAGPYRDSDTRSMIQPLGSMTQPCRCQSRYEVALGVFSYAYWERQAGVYLFQGAQSTADAMVESCCGLSGQGTCLIAGVDASRVCLESMPRKTRPSQDWAEVSVVLTSPLRNKWPKKALPPPDREEVR